MSHKLLEREARLRGRCNVLADLVQEIRPLYRDPATTQDQRNFIETTIGAALWYLPAVDECWTGKVSIEAIRSHHPDIGDDNPKLTADHKYPRKIAAADLLAEGLDDKKHSGSKLLSLYLSKYGRFNYITPHENRVLVRYQKKSEFVHPALAYEKAGINLITVTRAELRRVRSRDLFSVEKLLRSIE